ncbi:hypothetical protein EXIGLDRAFT_745415 [Exidia glandulosa HHB12029]|uniref:Uncharacterized protein n=1 Tax=Exidia glandulosa HHB12029 TaxID=1314781 RepID=A0A165NIR0_EXIGL|nr:hypothetical protein EXIGLDRAFT_745415 [Exidia glandulosa HHB12029]
MSGSRRSSSMSGPPGRRTLPFNPNLPLPRVPSVVPLGLQLDNLWVTPSAPPQNLLPELLDASSPAITISRGLFAVLAAIATFGAGLAYSTYFQARSDAHPLALQMMAWSWTSFIFCVVLSLVWQIVLVPDFDDGAPGRGFRHKLVIFAVLVICLVCILAGTVLLSLALVPDAGTTVKAAGYAVAGLIGVLTFASVFRFTSTVSRRGKGVRMPSPTVPYGWHPIQPPRHSLNYGFESRDDHPRSHALRRVTIEEPLWSRDPRTQSDIHLPAAGSVPGPIIDDTRSRLTESPTPVVVPLAEQSHADSSTSGLLTDDVALRRFTLYYARLAWPLLVIRRRYEHFDSLQQRDRINIVAQTYRDLHYHSPIWYPIEGPNNAPFDPSDAALMDDFLLHLHRWEPVLQAVWFDGFHQIPPNEMTRYMLAARRGIQVAARQEQQDRSQTA